MRFKEFLQFDETGTSTADIAGFSRICIPMVRRVWGSNQVEDMYPDEYEWNKKKKKHYEVPQLREADKSQDEGLIGGLLGGLAGGFLTRGAGNFGNTLGIMAGADIGNQIGNALSEPAKKRRRMKRSRKT
jgi:hypothetical protein